MKLTNQRILKLGNNNYAIVINNVSEMSLIQIKKIMIEQKAIKNIYIDTPNSNNSTKGLYNIETYELIRNKLDEIVQGINGDLSEKEKFAVVYNRICTNIAYDTPAIYPKTNEEKQYSKREFYNCRNLKNGLLYGKCVCAGYAEILRNALSLVDIESTYILGNISAELHAWNKVKLDGEWYNVDSTWDAINMRQGKFPEHCLKSDDTIKRFDGKNNFGGPVCMSDISPEKITDIFSSSIPEFKQESKVTEDIILGFADLGKSSGNFLKQTFIKVANVFNRIFKTKNVPALNEPSVNDENTFEENKNDVSNQSWNLENYDMTKEEFQAKSQEKTAQKSNKNNGNYNLMENDR